MGCRLVVHLFALLSTTRVTVARVLLYRYSGVWYRYKSRSGMILFQTGRNLHSISSSSSSRAALSLGMPRVAFVAGGTGVVGRYLLTRLSRKGSPWDVVYAGGRRKLDITPEVGGCPIVSVEVDLTSPEDCAEKVGHLNVTHFFFAAYAGSVSVEANLDLLRHVMHVLAASPSLKHVHLVQGTKWYGYGVLPGKFKTPAKESDPRCMPPLFYYNQQDLVVELQRASPCTTWTWSACRPHAVVGFSVGSAMNLTMVIAVYASICRELGLNLDFPGTEANYRAVYQMTDSALLAKGIEWMATTDACANEPFNITNGDFIRWEHVWPVIAHFFGVPLGIVRTTKLSETMRTPDKAALWKTMVDKYKLQDHTWDRLVNWDFADFVWHNGCDVMSSTIKCRQYGFHEYIDTEEMLLEVFGKMMDTGVIPHFAANDGATGVAMGVAAAKRRKLAHGSKS